MASVDFDPTIADQIEAELIDFEREIARRRDAPTDDVPTPSDQDAPRPRERLTDDERPEITVSPELSLVVDAAERALVQLGGIYVRGQRLVRVVRDRGAADWLRRPDGAPTIVAIPRDGVIELLARAAIWVTIRARRGGDPVPVRTVPPMAVAAMLMARGEWTLQQLDGISDAPVFRSDGTILDEPGYDAATRMIFDPGGVTFPPVPSHPSHAQATRALADLLEPFTEFPFVADTDRAAVGALILSVVGRSAIDGPVPMFACQAPTPGSGKGLLIHAVATIVTGRSSPFMSPTDEEEEIRKRLLSVALESPAMVLIDNVDGSFGSPTLAAALTAGEVKDRKLGTQETITATLRPVWTFTGNNVQLKSDLGRRVVPIDLDPKVEHPEDRTFDRRDLLAYVTANRPRLTTAALTVLRAYVVAGRPDHGLTPKGSYEAWDGLVRAAVIWAGGVDPLGGVARIREQSDDDLERIRALLISWHAAMGAMPMAVADAIRHSEHASDLRDALTAFCRSGRPESRPLGNAFRKIRDRVVAGHVLRRSDLDRDGIAKWTVQKTCNEYNQ